MQKKWLWSVMVCVLCVACLFGNCGAAEKNENWVKMTWTPKLEFFLDASAIKATEYNGRKYLDIKTKAVVFKNNKTIAEWHVLIDIAQGKVATLKFKKRHEEANSCDVSTAMSNLRDIDYIDERILERITSVCPAVVDDIMAYNHDSSLRSPIGNAVFFITRNTSGVGGAYQMLSEDGLMGITFDYKPESNLLVLYDLNEATPYSSQRYYDTPKFFVPWDHMKRNSADMHDAWNGEYERNWGTDVFEKVDNQGTSIFKWETDALLTFLRTRAWKHL
ncbi:hypothetical protein SAMN05216582_101104 [Selenomonas ruminantium]|uniref:Uncharacterized protein n=1 Tax=Selenomonas ruminantium TaxID=971 RepID=A0A1M6R1H7_SELRU|nr:hypothetical protein [Selenomonas ruminantium]SHK26304.1 hypothetical protein SAMN05216582_101104 [Selenomonas ruminantium]